MIDQKELIRLLNSSESISGTALGDALGVSRVAVQKKIQGLMENGLPVNAVSGKGYSLEDGITLLDGDTILKKSQVAELLTDVEVLQNVASTNTHLLSKEITTNRARICLAESQSSGRGRRGNNWQSSPYRNVMLSLSWGFDHWPATITGLGLAVSLCIVETLNNNYGLDVEIKWPNDLMVRNGDVYDKLGGILVDVAGESSGACNVVIGLGLNVHQPDWSQELGAAYQWQDLLGLGVKVDRNVLCADLIDALVVMLAEFSKTGFESMTERWNDLSSYAGKLIRVGDCEQYVEGYMEGVDAAGALLVRGKDDQLHRFVESTVSVRLVS